MNFTEILKFIAGLGIALLAGMILLGAMISENPEPKDWWLGFLFGVLPVAGGLWLCYSSIAGSRERKKHADEKAIIKLAGTLGGSVTVAEVVAHTSLNSKQAEDMLNLMQVKGLAHINVSQEGAIYYEFTGMRSQSSTHFLR